MESFIYLENSLLFNRSKR